VRRPASLYLHDFVARSLLEMKMLFAAVLLFSTLVLAQTAPPKTSSAGAKTQSGAASSQRHMMGGMQGMQGMGGPDMKAMVDHFQHLLAKMKADATSVTDPNAQVVMQDNIEMWQTLVEHMQAMQQHMGGGMGMGKGTGMGHGMMGGPHGQPAKPSTQTSPPKQ
jgi:hypothetical protein